MKVFSRFEAVIQLACSFDYEAFEQFERHTRRSTHAGVRKQATESTLAN